MKYLVTSFMLLLLAIPAPAQTVAKDSVNAWIVATSQAEAEIIAEELDRMLTYPGVQYAALNLSPMPIIQVTPTMDAFIGLAITPVNHILITDALPRHSLCTRTYCGINITLRNVVRHEFGHLIMDRVNTLAKQHKLKSWNKLYKSHHRIYWLWYLGLYSTTCSEEAFAESFCAYTGGMQLPKDLADWFDGTLK